MDWESGIIWLRMRFEAAALSVVLGLCLGLSFGGTVPFPNPDMSENSVMIGAFNVQVFGQSKVKKTNQNKPQKQRNPARKRQ